jgi:drug/metabolite transporter (DMT)-like permease
MGVAATPAAPSGRTGLAALWMVGAIVSFAGMAVGGRELSAELDTFEIMAYRSAIGFPIVAVALLAREGWRGAATDRPGLHAVRNVIHFTAQNAWFYGVATIPLAQLVALEFTSPIWVALLAPLMVGEALTRWKLLAAALGFAGVLIIAQPGVAPVEWGHAAGLAAAIGFAITNLITKRLTARDSLLCVLFWMTFSQMVMGFAVAIPRGFTLVSEALVPWTAFVGLCGLTAHYSLTRALTLAPASVVAPMEFARLPVIAVVGMLLYDEPLEIAVLLGALLILAGNTANIFGERRGQRRA